MRWFGRIATAALVPAAALVGPEIASAQQVRGPLYLVGAPDSVARAKEGGRVRACAPAAADLPANFVALRTAPAETPRAVALGICDVLVADADEAQAGAMALSELGMASQVALLPGSASTAPVPVSALSRAAATVPPPVAAPMPALSSSPTSMARTRPAPASMGPSPFAAPTAQVAQAPSRRAPAAAPEAQSAFYQGYEALEQGQPELAAGHFEQGLQASPNNALALYYLGISYEQLGETGRALASYERAARLAPGTDEGLRAAERVQALRGAAAQRGPAGATAGYVPSYEPPPSRSYDPPAYLEKPAPPSRRRSGSAPGVRQHCRRPPSHGAMRRRRTGLRRRHPPLRRLPHTHPSRPIRRRR
jgi:hypothetical protein